MATKKNVSTQKSLKKKRRQRAKLMRTWTIRIGIILFVIVFLLFMMVAFFTPPQQIG